MTCENLGNLRPSLKLIEDLLVWFFSAFPNGKEIWINEISINYHSVFDDEAI